MRTALIVGAGIGGLAAALALRRAGWRVRVFERASTLRDLGFALLLAPNAVAALESLGVAEAIATRGATVTRGEIRAAGGRLLRSFDQSTLRHLPDARTMVALRPVVHGALLDAVGTDTIALDSPAVRFRQTESKVSLVLAGGEQVEGDVLLGADGVGSTLRQLLHPSEAPPRPSGLFALRGVAHGAAHHLGDTSGAQFWGRGIESGMSRASTDAVYWYISMPAHLARSADTDVRALAERATNNFDNRLRRIIAATRIEDMRLDELYEREPLDRWGEGRVTLLGDAAHPMLPHAGQGAAQALEDAVVLGHALAAPPDVCIALRRYEDVRAARTRTVIQLARRGAQMASIENPVGCWLRNTMLRLVPDRVFLRSIARLWTAPDMR
jgi:2-polyprenyl-6-methoxyphenol hydroxylase-like FAD-dependent oxidoreductase